MLDVRRAAEDPEYVVRGDPEKSEIYVMVRDVKMPGEGANVPPLTPDEKESVRRWIKIRSARGAAVGTGEETVIKPQEAPKLIMPTWKNGSMGSALIYGLDHHAWD